MVRKVLVSLALLVALIAGVEAQASAWQQCGGQNWSGATSCIEGYRCQKINDYYSQCTPGAETFTTSTSSKPAQTSAGPSSTVTKDPTTTGPTKTGSGTNPGSTLVSGWYWVRAVAPPNFHSYLQSKPTGLPSTAFLDKASNAGQFNVIDGQLVYNTGTGGKLYMHVENPKDKTQRKLETWFATEKNSYGKFNFQGDTLSWHTDDIKRPNEAAWLVCEEQKLFINTGAYGYQTPAGCADQTIHYYGGSTPDV